MPAKRKTSATKAKSKEPKPEDLSEQHSLPDFPSCAEEGRAETAVEPEITASKEVASEQTDESKAATPLDYMLSVMRDPAVEPARRDEMAKLALPYMHPKVTAPEPPAKDIMPAEPGTRSDTDIARRIAFTLAKAMWAEPAAVAG
jgi:hypothetical protein